jgi:hypothetical protein
MKSDACNKIIVVNVYPIKFTGIQTYILCLKMKGNEDVEQNVEDMERQNGIECGSSGDNYGCGGNRRRTPGR